MVCDEESRLIHRRDFMAREEKSKRSAAENGSREPRETTANRSTAEVSAEDIRRLVAKLKGEDAKK